MSEGSFFMPGGLRSFTRGGKEKPGNPGAIGKKVKSTLVLIILKKYFCFFLCLFVLFFVFFLLNVLSRDHNRTLRLVLFYSFNWEPSIPCGRFRFCSEPVVMSHCGFPGSCAGTGLLTPSKLCRCEFRLKLMGYLCFER